MELDPAVAELAEAYGIAIDWWDWQGVHTQVPPTTIDAALAALGVDAGSPTRRGPSLAARETARWERMLPPCRGDPPGLATDRRRARATRPAGAGVDRSRGRRRPSRNPPGGELELRRDWPAAS